MLLCAHYLHSSDNSSDERHGIMGLRSNNGRKQLIEKEDRVYVRDMIRYNNGSYLPWCRFSFSSYPLVPGTVNRKGMKKRYFVGRNDRKANLMKQIP